MGRISGQISVSLRVKKPLPVATLHRSPQLRSQYIDLRCRGTIDENNTSISEINKCIFGVSLIDNY